MTDEALLGHLAEGGPPQRAALERLYHGKGREFGRFFIGRGLGHQDAEDALQETILKILQHSAAFRGQGTASAWMWQIARNTLSDCLRRQTARREDVLDDRQWEQAENDAPALQTSGEPDATRLAEDCVAQGLARFAAADPERAYAMELTVEGLDLREIAERIGRTYGATREFLSQCRRRLAPFIAHCLPLLQD